MGAWSKMMTAPGFQGMHPPAHFSMEKIMSAEKDEKALESPGNQDEVASLKSADDLNGASDLESEMVSENDEEVPATLGTDDSPIPREGGKKRDTSDSLKRKDSGDGHRDVDHENEGAEHKRRRASRDCEEAEDLRLETYDDSGDHSSRHTPPQTEIKSQRPPGLLAQHGLVTHKSHERNHASETPMKDLRDTIKTERSLPLHPPMGPLDFTHPAFLERQFSRPPSTPGSPTSIGMLNGDSMGSHNAGHHWTFEEQFKQLYELSDDSKRKEFLDDLFSFMQTRGTPVNRIPIMAKQPLDLYELFRLVASKGGLVEVINKKLWREICKGLNLPSSITSAAFTLRTQYMKYLYPYECEKLKLSNPAELQAAIDGNRREGRRPGYGYDFSPLPSMIPPSPHHLNGNPFNGRFHHLHPDDDGLTSPPPPHIRTFAEREHLRAMEAAHQVMEEAKKRMEEVHRSVAPPLLPPPIINFSKDIGTPTNGLARNTSPLSAKAIGSESDPNGPSKRLTLSGGSGDSMDDLRDAARDARDAREREMRERFERFLPPHLSAAMPSAHLKITSRNDGRADFDNSLVVSMEVNGIMYQGVLFAQHMPRRL